ncbi:Retrovirus-related Pol polyprotein from transposon TNT 1-94 [Vitis vinifera]|uniref:Retrovirus-related Pol polyprotein from transposon TNT 1-94 n=1 Tax=Vitis vinifera TaxID=29760 RepID=A0A438DLG3_VITVI|nr:Retrovirus-related Pol polyprotein from transposon TNT 1-94 [Vitis vinifera]
MVENDKMEPRAPNCAVESAEDLCQRMWRKFRTAKEVWDTVKRSYLDVSYSSQAYELMKKSFQSCQGGSTLTKYYNELNLIFMELDYQRSNDMTCVANIEKQRKHTAEDRVYIFLVGLDRNLDQMFGGRWMVIWSGTSVNKLIGRTRNQLRFALTNATPPASASQVSQLSSQEVNSDLAFISTTSNTWVIDSRTTDHMITHSSLLNSLMPSLVKFVQVSNGTPMLISGAENISLSSHSPCPLSYLRLDNLTKMTIGIGREEGGLYYLEGAKELQYDSNCVFQVAREMSGREKILLWHCQLVPLQVEISGKEEDMLWLKEKRLWISSQGEDSIDLRKGESLILPTLWQLSLHLRKEGMEDQLDYFNKMTLPETNPKEISSVIVKSLIALEDPKWKSSMIEEMKALPKNSTQEMVELPQEKKTVGCKWVFSVKDNSNGIIDRYKVRLVAKEYTQTYRIDYQGTFAHIAKMNIVRVILSLVVNLDRQLREFDAKDVFLYDDLLEKVYMDPHPGFTPKKARHGS